MQKSSLFTLHFLLFLLTSCQHPQVPEDYSQVNTLPKIYPDYADVTIPVNIAPLCFELLNEADEAVTRITADSRELLCQGLKARPDMTEWKELLATAQGKELSVEVFAEKDGQWVRYKPFAIHVSPDSIDPWLSYRLIAPSYVSYEELTINQRCLENFDEETIVNNMLCSSESGGQCINCHSFQQRNPRNMQFHARQAHGGTIITYDDSVEFRVNSVEFATALRSAKGTAVANSKLYTLNSTLKNSTLPLVYPSWHPTEKLIAYSCNKTVQSFHTVDPDKIEVYDAQSYLVLYDIENHKLTTIEDLPDELETFPSWAPDGKSLYYCSAHFEYESDSVNLEELTLRTRDLKYNIYRRSFNPATHEFGERERVFDSAECRVDSTPGSVECRVDSTSSVECRVDSVEFATAHDASAKGTAVANSKLYTLNSTLKDSSLKNSSLKSSSLPRISPDGRWLLFTLSEYGTFHIWHRDADLWLMDLTTGQVRPLEECNSPETESYHCWSGNSRWIVFSSRRHDGVFTRPFIAHIDADGNAAKPFELPSQDPDYHLQLLKSYNVPELMTGPVTVSPQTFAAKLKSGRP